MSNLIRYIIQEDPEKQMKKNDLDYTKYSTSWAPIQKQSQEDKYKGYKFSSKNLLENSFNSLTSNKSSQNKDEGSFMGGISNIFNNIKSDEKSSSNTSLPQSIAKTATEESSKIGNILSPKSIGNDAASYKIAQNNKGNTNTNLSYKIGTLSGISESGNDPAAIGKDNSGGPSYGAYQIATYTGTMNKYLNFIKNNPQYKEFSEELEKAGGNKAAILQDPNFVKTWKALSQNDNFNNSQYNFIINTHLQPLLNSVQNKELLNIDGRHPVVKDALYSMSVQHGKAAQIVNNTLEELQKKDIKIDDATLLKALYKKRTNYVNSLPVSQHPGDGKITQNEKDNIVNKRYPNELDEALKYLGL